MPRATDAKASSRILAALALVAFGVIALDQGAKWWAVDSLQPGERHSVIGDFFTIELVRNSGAAFSMGSSWTWLLSIIATAVVVVVIWFAPRIRSLAWGLVFGLLLGGTLGNLLDRFFREPSFGQGHVIDFLILWPLPAVFNLADVAISASMVIFLILTLTGVPITGKKPDTDETEAAATDAADGDAAAAGESASGTDTDTESPVAEKD